MKQDVRDVVARASGFDFARRRHVVTLQDLLCTSGCPEPIPRHVRSAVHEHMTECASWTLPELDKRVRRMTTLPPAVTAALTELRSGGALKHTTQGAAVLLACAAVFKPNAPDCFYRATLDLDCTGSASAAAAPTVTAAEIAAPAWPDAPPLDTHVQRLFCTAVIRAHLCYLVHGVVATDAPRSTFVSVTARLYVPKGGAPGMTSAALDSEMQRMLREYVRPTVADRIRLVGELLHTDAVMS